MSLERAERGSAMLELAFPAVGCLATLSRSSCTRFRPWWVGCKANELVAWAKLGTSLSTHPWRHVPKGLWVALLACQDALGLRGGKLLLSCSAWSSDNPHKVYLWVEIMTASDKLLIPPAIKTSSALAEGACPTTSPCSAGGLYSNRLCLPGDVCLRGWITQNLHSFLFLAGTFREMERNGKEKNVSFAPPLFPFSLPGTLLTRAGKRRGQHLHLNTRWATINEAGGFFLFPNY